MQSSKSWRRLPITRSANYQPVATSTLSFHRFRRRRRPRPVPGPVEMEPPNRAVRVAFQAPSVLVNQLVVERAHQDQVVQVGPAFVLPQHDVMGLGEPAGPASGKGALPVPVPELTEHGLGGLPAHPSQAEGAGPEESSSTVWTRAVHSRRRAVWGWTAGTPSISQDWRSPPPRRWLSGQDCAAGRG
jgi:hypothetical protein